MNIPATKQNIINLQKQKIPIIDIRLPSEWKSTGTIPNALKITFFTQRGGINPKFLEQLKMNHISLNSKFAIICRTGHRSKIASRILEKNGYISVIDLKGGMFNLFKDLLKEVRYGK
jgi:rhodanese-related sulfurtransferase